MRLVVIYRNHSDHARPVIDYLRDFERRTSRQIETKDPDFRDGAEFASLYDIVEYPTIIALDDSGIMQNMWRGLPLPTIDEVSYYAQ